MSQIQSSNQGSIEKKQFGCDCERCDLRDLFFDHVDDTILAEICSSKEENNYEKGDLIIREGEDLINFIYLRSGLVKLYRTDKEGKSQIIKIGKPLDFVSLLSVFSDTMHKYSVTALEHSVTCSIKLSRIIELAKENGEFALNLMQKMSRVYDQIIIDFLEIRKKHLRGRTAHVLLFFADSVYKSKHFELPISRKEIAEFIGMTPENVIRTLSEFRKDNLISINGKQIAIIEKKKLLMISEHG